MRHWLFKRLVLGWPISLCVLGAADSIFVPVFASRAASDGGQVFYPIDFSAQATRQWTEFRPWINWNPPAGGLQHFDGVPFQLDGVIQFRCISPRSANDALPTRARGILVGRRFARLHLFHFSEFSGQPGEPAVKFVLHGVDGKDNEFVVRYDVHFQDWSHWPQGPDCSDHDTRAIWRAPPRLQPENPFMTVLWHTVFANPRPGVEVASVEVCSLLR